MLIPTFHNVKFDNSAQSTNSSNLQRPDSNNQVILNPLRLAFWIYKFNQINATHKNKKAFADYHHHGATSADTKNCKAFSMKSFCNQMLILEPRQAPWLLLWPEKDSSCSRLLQYRNSRRSSPRPEVNDDVASPGRYCFTNGFSYVHRDILWHPSLSK